jgi:hypothetical protein
MIKDREGRLALAVWMIYERNYKRSRVIDLWVMICFVEMMRLDLSFVIVTCLLRIF